MDVTSQAILRSEREMSWDIDGMRFAGLSWGEQGGLPVLALHGWLDHAASFQRLAPLLTDCHVVALDLSGHGLSACRADHASYNIWDDIPQILRVIDLLGWHDCYVLGHSRGANIAAVLAAAMPEAVRGLISLDCIAPEPSETDFTTTMRKHLIETRAQLAKEPRHFTDQESYIRRRIAQGNAEETARILAPRALEPVEGGVILRGDPRLFAGSAVKLGQAQVENVLRAINCPVLNIWATDGASQRSEKIANLTKLAQDLVPNYQAVTVEGDHHFHLNSTGVAKISGHIRAFLSEVEQMRLDPHGGIDGDQQGDMLR